jgi:hypothetical protein
VAGARLLARVAGWCNTHPHRHCEERSDEAIQLGAR